MRVLAGSLITSFALVACGGDENKQQPDAHVAVDAASNPDAPPEPLTGPERAAIHLLSPLPAVPADTTNAFADNALAAALGQKLFYDKSYSGALAVGDDGTNGGLGMVGETGKASCASCHAASSETMVDLRSAPNNVSLGTDFGTRNALGIINSSFLKWTNWGGRFDSQWSLPIAVSENPKIMKSTRLQVAHMLYAKYRTEYNAVFPTPLDPALDPAAADASRFPATGKPKALPADPPGAWEGMTSTDQDAVNRIIANYGKALAAYLRKLTSGNAPFDRYVAGDKTAISMSAIRGIKVFLAKGCVTCHSGPSFSDGLFHALVVPQTGAHVPAVDKGRNQDVPPLLASLFNTSGPYSDDTNTGKLTGLVQDPAQTGLFRTPTLRNVALSGSFMHSGQFATLEEVVAFYDQGGGDPGTSGVVKDPLIVPLSLSAQDKTDLVELLKTLTGEPVTASLLVDTSK
jgi:cytochrome c peroxidase